MLNLNCLGDGMIIFEGHDADAEKTDDHAGFCYKAIKAEIDAQSVPI